MNEEKICIKTKRLIDKLDGNNKALLNELKIQYDNSKYKEKLHSKINLFDVEDGLKPVYESLIDKLLNELVDANYLLKRLNRRIEKNNFDLNEKIEIFSKIRFTKQKILFLKEVISSKKLDELSHNWTISCNDTKEICGQYLTIRLVGCKGVKSADDLSHKSILTGLPISIRTKLKDEMKRNNIKISLYPKIQCQLYSNSDELLYSTQPSPMTHHCWNESFSLPLPLETPLKLFVVWISPFSTLSNILSHYPHIYHQLHFNIAGMKYLFPSSLSHQFQSTLLKLFPMGELYLEIFNKPLLLKKQMRKPVSKSHKIQLSDVKLVSVIGRGYFGKVFLCKIKYHHKLFALKAIKKDYVVDRNEFEQLSTEKSVLQLATFHKHPLIVELLACLQNNAYVMFLMDFVEAGDVATLLCKQQQFTIEQTRFYAASIVLCLEFLHANHIIYRDIKTENLMLDRYGYIKLVDFGLSKLNMIPPNNFTSTLCGTLDYMAPEMFDKSVGYSFPVDWWALGVITYIMCTGQVPFDCDTNNSTIAEILDTHKPIQIPPEISRTNVFLASFILALMNRNSNSRLGSRNGADEVKVHPFFRNSRVNFESIYHRTAQPPFQPDLNDSTDLSYFDSQFTNEPPDFSVTEVTDIFKKCQNNPQAVSFFNMFCS